MKKQVSCNNCGNLLELHQGTKFVACNNCQAQLEVVKTDNSLFTKNRKSSKRQSSIAENRRSSEDSFAEIYEAIDMLDQKWNNQFVVKGASPDRNVKFDTFMGIFVIIFGIACTIMAALMAPMLVFLGIIFIIGGTWGMLNLSDRRSKYLKAKKKYEEERAALKNKLNH